MLATLNQSASDLGILIRQQTLVDNDSHAGSPKITVLGRLVLYERITSDPKVVVGEKNLKFSTVVEAKIEAHVIASQVRNMAHQALNGNFLSDVEP